MPFAEVIRDHLELVRRNAALEYDMPLARYLSRESRQVGEPQQRRTHDDEDTIDGGHSIADEETLHGWPAREEVAGAAKPEPEETGPAEEVGWPLLRDFDWGD